MHDLLGKIFLTSLFSGFFFAATTVMLYMLADATENETLETLCGISFILLCTCPIVAIILAIVGIWV